MASTKTSKSESGTTTDPSSPTTGVHPTPEEAAEMIARETEEYRSRKAEEAEKGASLSAAQQTEPQEGLLTSGSDNAKLGTEFVAEDEAAVEAAKAARK